MMGRALERMLPRIMSQDCGCQPKSGRVETLLAQLEPPLGGPDAVSGL